jgi:hypothetical protein
MKTLAAPAVEVDASGAQTPEKDHRACGVSFDASKDPARATSSGRAAGP